MKVLKASAGSGKTYKLSEHYRNLLKKDPRAYRNILAVTFTNKAAADMKRRILKDLYEEAKPGSKEEESLLNILHDYSAFSVCTIDKFFQRTLKAFAHEIGCFADYQIELDRKQVIQEAMDRILDSLTEDSKDLLAWIRGSLEDKLSAGQKFRVDAGLADIGNDLKSQAHRSLAEEFGVKDSELYSTENLKKLRKECRKIISAFENRMKSEGVAVEPGKKIEFKTKKAFNALSPEGQDFYIKEKGLYITALKINELIYSLGLAGEFDREFDALMKEKNIMCLDESNLILRDIIDGSDAPFVYEKLGVRYHNFLLDEFQDTSNIQWQNFLPLLRESEAGDGDNLIVGDVKQSIYRWRDSDWKLLAERVEQSFHEITGEPMEDNWRSAKTIVNFNNDFFEYAAAQVGLSKLYSGVRQHVKSDEKQEGSVKVTFCDDQLKAVSESVQRALENGAQLGDIAIVVRNNKEGSRVASHLIGEGINVISDDSLKLKSSPTVCRLASMMSLMDNPEDRIGGYFVSSMELELPAEYHSLVDLCEDLLRSLEQAFPGCSERESIFIQAFIDDVKSWSEVNGNNLHQYLEHWSAADPAINCPENSGSVRIITIHKSKGLEFKYVIFPFAEKVDFYNSRSKTWCYIDEKPELKGLYCVNLSSDMEDSLFSKNYLREKEMQLIDNLNVFYVALTRAEKDLHIISTIPPDTFKKSLKKTPEPKNFSQLLYAFCGGLDERVYGTPYDYELMDRKQEEKIDSFPAQFPSIPLAGRLTASEDAVDFFGEDGVVGAAASARISGIVLHDILSRVSDPSDLRSSVDMAVFAGKLSAGDAEQNYELLKQAIESKPQWFTSRGRNEVTLYDAFGNEKRPDRVVFTENGVEIIDYKFGSFEKKYEYQIRDYIKIYRGLGYKNVKGCLWFVRTGEVMNFT